MFVRGKGVGREQKPILGNQDNLIADEELTEVKMEGNVRRGRESAGLGSE